MLKRKFAVLLTKRPRARVTLRPGLGSEERNVGDGTFYVHRLMKELRNIGRKF
ncbi:hypothetical protein DSBG_1782 [Desulfosporosinus sp. BG]|nr:hypothetical protein DSBG_1782 [Desulfosporosinus sp. BG]